MSEALGRLTEIAGDGLMSWPALSEREASLVPPDDIAALLQRRNGFYAFESALHVFPSGGSRLREGSIEHWNSPDLWKERYSGLADGLFFFAEDAFGGQFGWRDGSIWAFDPETGEASFIADSISGWADEILNDFAYWTGHSVAHDWQQANGLLPANCRLVPKQLFVLGGEFKVDNLVAMDRVKGMRLRGEVARQIRDLPDGSTITFELTD